MSSARPSSLPRTPWRLGPRAQWWFDVALATALLLPSLGVYGLTLVWPFGSLQPNGVAELLLSLTQLVPLYWRRSHPLPVFAVVSLASAAQVLVLDLPLWSQVAFPVATYSVARFATVFWSLAAFGVGLVAAGVAVSDWFVLGTDQSWRFLIGPTLSIAAVVLAAWALGILARTRRAYEDSLVERAERIAREATQRVALAASDERARIAREMHDVVAHGLTTMVVQADGARYAAEHRPQVAVETLDRIAETGRASLVEMRRLLGVLREDHAAAATAPQPRLPDLEALIADSGAEADLRGLDRPVSDGSALTAYRVVQESLSNIRKHAGPGVAATVRVTVAERGIEVEVADDGRGAAADSDGEGLGLLGMRERVAAHDGDLETGPRPGGGWLVRATIPL